MKIMEKEMKNFNAKDYNIPRLTMLRTNKCPQGWKEGKIVMLPKPVANEEEKKRPENW
jgi:hypothetical protein